MFIAYVVVTLLLGGYLGFSACADFVRYQQVLVAMARAGVPESWLPLLGTLKAAAAIGLLLRLGVPLIGMAAALGISLFFVGALLRVVFPGSFLVLAVAALALALPIWTPGQVTATSCGEGVARRTRVRRHSAGRASVRGQSLTRECLGCDAPDLVSESQAFESANQPRRNVQLAGVEAVSG
jgi:DoxX-like family